MVVKRKWIQTQRSSTLSGTKRVVANIVKRAITTANKRRAVSVVTPTPMYMSPRSVEKKYLDVFIGSTTGGLYGTDGVTGASGIVCINPLSLGTSAFNRIGRNVTITSIFYRGIISFKVANNGPISQVTRTLIVQDKQANGTTQNIGDILLPGTPATSSTVFAPMNLANSMRFKIISDEVRILLVNGALPGGAGPAADTANICWIENYLKTNIRVTYNTGTNGDHRDIATNALLMCFVGALAKTNVNGPIFSGICRIRFTDD